MDEATRVAIQAKYPQLTEKQLSLISMEAYDRGHAHGQQEVNLYALAYADFAVGILNGCDELQS
jgi:hypothetical protein